MTFIRTARVLSVSDSDGLIAGHLVVELLDGPGVGDVCRAISYPEFGVPPSVGDVVGVNTAGIEMGLGTGGEVFVLPSGGGDVPANDDHFMKLPYTPLQFPVKGTELPDSIEGITAVVLPLHSHLAVACCYAKKIRPDAKVVFVWGEGGSIAVASSRVLEELRGGGVLDLVVSAGNCYGGDIEEPNIYAGLLAASSVGADVILCGIGPGIVGSGRAFGHGGMSAATSANAAVSLGAEVVSCPRISGADSRRRHAGVSHHTRQALGATLSPVRVPIPEGMDESVLNELPGRHEYVVVTCGAGGLEDRFGLTFESMGRSYTDDEIFFDAAAAAVHLALSGDTELVSGDS